MAENQRQEGKSRATITIERPSGETEKLVIEIEGDPDLYLSVLHESTQDAPPGSAALRRLPTGRQCVIVGNYKPDELVQCSVL